MCRCVLSRPELADPSGLPVVSGCFFSRKAHTHMREVEFGVHHGSSVQPPHYTRTSCSCTVLCPHRSLMHTPLSLVADHDSRARIYIAAAVRGEPSKVHGLRLECTANAMLRLSGLNRQLEYAKWYACAMRGATRLGSFLPRAAWTCVSTAAGAPAATDRVAP